MFPGGSFSNGWPEILDGLIQRRESAWKELLHRCNRLVRWAMEGVLARNGLVQETEIDDLVQGLWLFLLSDGHLRRIRDPQALRSWLVTVAQNYARALLRRKRWEIPSGIGMGSGESDGLADLRSNPRKVLEEAELKSQVQEALGRLRVEQRRIVEEKFWAQEGVTSICRREGIGRNTYWSRFRSAKKKLSASLQRIHEVEIH